MQEMSRQSAPEMYTEFASRARLRPHRGNGYMPSQNLVVRYPEIGGVQPNDGFWSDAAIECGRLLSTADSIDRRNALAKSFRWRLEAECLSGPFVQPASDGIELVLMNIRQVHPFWEVLAQ